MKKEEMDNLTKSMQKKLGKEKAGLIADDIAKIILNNENMNRELKEKDTEIERINGEKETLYMANGNLLQQVAMGEDNKKEEKEDKKQKISLNDAFDEKGNFKI